MKTLKKESKMFPIKSGWYHDLVARDGTGWVLENLVDGEGSPAGIAGTWYLYDADNRPVWLLVGANGLTLCDLYLCDTHGKKEKVGTLKVEDNGKDAIKLTWEYDRKVQYPDDVLSSPLPPANFSGVTLANLTLNRVG